MKRKESLLKVRVESQFLMLPLVPLQPKVAKGHRKQPRVPVSFTYYCISTPNLGKILISLRRMHSRSRADNAEECHLHAAFAHRSDSRVSRCGTARQDRTRPRNAPSDFVSCVLNLLEISYRVFPGPISFRICCFNVKCPKHQPGLRISARTERCYAHIVTELDDQKSGRNQHAGRQVWYNSR